MSSAAVLLLAYSGLSLISLSMHRHARDVGLKSPPSWLRGLGWAAIALSLTVVVTAPNWRFALVEWTGLLATAAALVVLTLQWRPGALPLLSAGGGLGGVVAGLILMARV